MREILWTNCRLNDNKVAIWQVHYSGFLFGNLETTTLPLAWRTVEAAATAAGLVPRGGFVVEPADGVPAAAPGRPAVCLVLLGAVGDSLWPAFSAAPEYRDGRPDPLDRWSRRVIEGLAQGLGARALFPFGGPPWLPFQRWAARAEPVHPSPLGLFIHPRHGLWHSYRGALAFAGRLAGLPPREDLASPCVTCTERPCLNACPVEAFALLEGATRYDTQACAAHISVPAGDDCRQGGCRARRACPVAPRLAPGRAQNEFHMGAFLAARRAERR